MEFDKDTTADRLIDWHFSIDSGTIAVYRILSNNENSKDEPIKLLEINEDTIETGRVDAFVFGPTEEVPYSTIMAVVTQAEMTKIENGEIQLPGGWDLKSSRKYARPEKQYAVK